MFVVLTLCQLGVQAGCGVTSDMVGHLMSLVCGRVARMACVGIKVSRPTP